MNVQKVKALTYSIYLNLNGYKVLKNSKDTPSTYVRAFKYYNNISPDTLDNFEKYTRVTKDFSDAKPKKIKETLLRDNFATFDKKPRKIDYKKQIRYTKYIEREKHTTEFKSQIHLNDLKKRRFGEINRKIFFKRETVIDLSKAFLGYISEKNITIKRSLAEIEREKYYSKIKEKEETGNKFHTNFLLTLVSNFRKRV